MFVRISRAMVAFGNHSTAFLALGRGSENPLAQWGKGDLGESGYANTPKKVFATMLYAR